MISVYKVYSYLSNPQTIHTLHQKIRDKIILNYVKKFGKFCLKFCCHL